MARKGEAINTFMTNLEYEVGNDLSLKYCARGSLPFKRKEVDYKRIRAVMKGEGVVKEKKYVTPK